MCSSPLISIFAYTFVGSDLIITYGVFWAIICTVDTFIDVYKWGIWCIIDNCSILLDCYQAQYCAINWFLFDVKTFRGTQFLIDYNLACVHFKHIPSQSVPFPRNPESQSHLKEPTVFVHKALLWQLWLPVEHSSISGK